MEFKIEDIQKVFHDTFREEFRTSLEYGADEPFYEAAKAEQDEHRIICRSDFFASALHEISHWCVAGKQRRTLDDFGYWYNPDGRDINQQRDFEKVEVTPQALEKAFSVACNYPFQVSVDNLSLDDYDSSGFESKVNERYSQYLENGFPKRAGMFVTALKDFYSVP